MAVLLASDETMYMTGAEINIDGGILAGSAAASLLRQMIREPDMSEPIG